MYTKKLSLGASISYYDVIVEIISKNELTDLEVNRVLDLAEYSDYCILHRNIDLLDAEVCILVDESGKVTRFNK